MNNLKKKTIIGNFSEEMSAAYHLDNSTFSDLYYWHYFDRTAALKKEIIDNLNSLPTARFNTYIKYVKDEIDEAFCYDPDECIIEKWIIQFNLKKENFPFYSNKKVTQLLSISKNDYPSNLEKSRSIRTMQLQFHWYAAYLEYLKMKAFIEPLLLNESHRSTTVAIVGDKPNFENLTWFKVGILFANGKAEELYNKYKNEKGHFTKITLELGFKKTDRPYFSETINNSTNSTKNIYNSFSKIKKIHDHCVINKILIKEDFMRIFNALQAK
ncbi:MAG: hypothetical protein ABJI22_03835 [Maribacter sp.]